MAFMAASAFAQEKTLVSERDFTTGEDYPYFRMEPAKADIASFDVKDGALVIEATAPQTNMWDVQPFVLDWFNLEEGAKYEVSIDMEASAEGEYWLAMGTWNGSMPLYGLQFAAGRQTLVNVFESCTPEAATSGNDAHILFQCGFFVGTIKIYKVALYKVNADRVNAVKSDNTQARLHNLVGQQVRAGYKGIVIQNGKKHIQK